MANKILEENEILLRIAKIREKLGDTDRTDNLKELEQWEAKAKKALIFLNLKGHEGIEMIINKAKEEILNRQESLKSKRPASLDPQEAIKYASDRAFDFLGIDMWTWFLNLFLESELDLKEVLDSIGLEENPIEEDYMGNQK